jgi:hypothetical protein
MKMEAEDANSRAADAKDGPKLLSSLETLMRLVDGRFEACISASRAADAKDGPKLLSSLETLWRLEGEEEKLQLAAAGSTGSGGSGGGGVLGGVKGLQSRSQLKHRPWQCCGSAKSLFKMRSRPLSLKGQQQQVEKAHRHQPVVVSLSRPQRIAQSLKRLWTGPSQWGLLPLLLLLLVLLLLVAVVKKQQKLET